LLAVGIVDCSDFPLSFGKRPFIVLADVDVVFLEDRAFEDETEVGDIGAGFSNYLTVEVKLQRTFLVESL
jgi:hypothetical protein